jgi:GNAT superfamily N-acetyltransferase
MTSEPILTLSAERDPRADEVVSGGLAAFNKAVFGRVDAQILDVLVREAESGEIVGGLLGHSSLGLFFLDLFYLPEELRGAGLGTRIMALAEGEAKRRGCTAAFVYTVRFRRPASTSATATAGLAKSPARRTAPPAFSSARRSIKAGGSTWLLLT